MSGRPSGSTRLSALIVNYNTGAYACACVESLRAEWARSGREPARLEIVVVDNASPRDQSEHLEHLESTGVRVVRAPGNEGYAAGMNRAFAETSGGPEDVVAILNPDLFFLPGSLDAMLDYLAEHPECGALDPKATVDHGLAMNLPRNLLPTVREQAFTVASQLHPVLSRPSSRHRVRNALPWWTSEEPIDTAMLSGCCMLMRREVIDRLPTAGLMDDRYPLYYEDADLCRTVTGLGYRLVHHTGARILHHWSRSSGVGEEFHGDPMDRYWVSQRAYYDKFCGPLGRGAVRFVNWLARTWPKSWSFRPMHPLVSLGGFDAPFEVQLPRKARFLLELGMAPTWILTVGMFGEGDRWVCPPEMWEWLFQADYFLRAVDLDSGEVLGAWHVQKSVPGREQPMTLEELERIDLDRIAPKEVPA